MRTLETFSCSSIKEINADFQNQAIHALENGKVVFFPKIDFTILESEKKFFSPHIVSLKSKNVSYSLFKDKLGGVKPELENDSGLRELLKRYATESKKLFETLFPRYKDQTKQGRTSFRPVETEGRCLSRKKDDTLLHVDAFPASPVNGQRILRIFTNVNPLGKPRVWNVGEPFSQVVENILPQVAPPFPFSSFFLRLLQITKSKRTAYDHYMLKIHDTMKMDINYQKNVNKEKIEFPASSTWIVFTDQVSHAALSGQFLFEQTFYVPVSALKDISTSPLKTLEVHLKKPLI